MRLSFNEARRSRKTLIAMAAMALALVAPAAEARPGAGVVVASSSPTYATGRVIEVGEAIRMERGATITVLEEGGRLTTISANGAYRPSNSAPATRAAPRGEGGSIVDSLAILLGSDRPVRAPGGVRTLDSDIADPCGGVDPGDPYLALDRALRLGCEDRVRGIVASWTEREAPPHLFLQFLPPPEGAPHTLQLQVQANFESYLYCRMRRADSRMVALTPEPGALPLRASASQAHAFTLPATDRGGAVQCMAVGSRAGETPNVGDWPNQLDTQRIEQAGVQVATMNIAVPNR